jgi:murein DD-endopeptidase MepM/ murein hydrolase activator NlpD
MIKSKKNNFKKSAADKANKTGFVPFIISYIILIAVFVDKPNMAPIIEKQHVVKRRKTFSSRHNNKSTNVNTAFMNQFSQKPAHIRKKRPVSLFEAFIRARRQKAVKIPRNKESHATDTERKHSSGFSFSLPLFGTVAVIAGIVVIALAAFNWENLNIRVPDIYAARPAEDTEAEQRAIQYATTGITEVIDRLNPPAMDEVSDEKANTNTKTDNPHGSLVTFQWQQYKVKKGDSVSTIAKKYDVSIGAIIASNNITNARKLQEGAILKIPNIDGIPYQIQKGDNLSKISASFKVPLEVILDVNDIKSDNIRAGDTLFIPGARMNDIDLRMSLGETFMYPLHQRFITSSYGMRKDPISGSLSFHPGVDLRANTGTAVLASLDGVVSFTGENWLYGKYIIISHSNGYKTMYGHLNSFSVKKGDRVTRGRKIAESGNTGYSTGPHLHFGIYDKNNKLVNPLELLN